MLYHAAVLARLLLSQTKAAPPEGLQQAAELLHDHGLLVGRGAAAQKLTFVEHCRNQPAAC